MYIQLDLEETGQFKLIRRKLFLHHCILLLQHHHSTWLYHLPEEQHINLRCWKNVTWTSTTKQLKGNGFIHGTYNFLLTSDKFQTFTRISGIFKTAIEAEK